MSGLTVSGRGMIQSNERLGFPLLLTVSVWLCTPRMLGPFNKNDVGLGAGRRVAVSGQPSSALLSPPHFRDISIQWLIVVVTNLEDIGTISRYWFLGHGGACHIP